MNARILPLALWGSLSLASAEPATSPPRPAQPAGEAVKPAAGEEILPGTGTPAAPSPGPLPEAMITTSTTNQAGLAIYRCLAASKELLPEDGNLLLSPSSVEPLLGALHAGAGGKTAQELGRLLGIKSGPAAAAAGKSSGLSEGAAMWVNQDWEVKVPFAGILQERWGAAPRPLAIGAAPDTAVQEVNAWIAEATAGKIPKLFEAGDFDKDTRLVLACAMAYEGRWDQPFDPEFTKPGDFATGKGRSVQTPFMHQLGRFASLHGEDGTEVVALGLQGGAQRCVLLLPPRGKDPLKALSAVEERLTPEYCRDLGGRLEEGRIELRLPRFNLKARTSVKAALQSLGAGSMFRAGKADFTGINDEPGLCVSVLRHEATLELDEEGARGAAASGAALATRSVGQPPRLVYFDRPFAFYIEEVASKRILFAGRLVTPPAVVAEP